MRKILYSGNVKDVTFRDAYSPVGFTNIVEGLDGKVWDSDSDSCLASFTRTKGRELSYDVRVVQGVKIMYCSVGNVDKDHKFTGRFRAYLESDDEAALVRIEKTIRDCITSGEFCKN